MNPDLTNPSTYSLVRQNMIDQGVKPSKVDSFLRNKVTQMQTFQAAEEGIIGKEAAFTALQDVPGAVSRISGFKGAGVEPLTGADAKLVASAKSGLVSAQRARKRLGEEEGKFSPDLLQYLGLVGARTGKLPIVGGDITPFGRGLEADLYNLADVVLRLRTGAAAPEQEIQRFMKVLAPSPLDPPDVWAQKIGQVELELNELLEQMGVSAEELLGGEAAGDLTAQGVAGGIPQLGEAGRQIGEAGLLGDQGVAEQALEEEPEPFLSPSTILSTVGDIAGGDIGPISALLAGGGEFAGEIIEGSPLEEAGREALTAGVISGTTPAALRLGGKVVSPAIKKVGQLLQNTVGRNLTKLGNRVLSRVGGNALDRGINIFDEIAERGLNKGTRQEALDVIEQSFKKAESAIKEGIEEAGDPLVVSNEQIGTIFDDAAADLLDTADKAAIERLKEDILGKFGDDLVASQVLRAKRAIFKKVAGASKGAGQMKYVIARQLNDLLKESVEAARVGLREEETLYFLEEIFKRLRNTEFVSGPNLNPFFLGQSLIRSIGPRRFAQAGQAVETAGKAIQQAPERLGPAAQAVTRAVRQPIRGLLQQ